MINDLVVSNDQFDGDMMKYADDTNVSEYITDQAENSSLQEVTNSIVDWSERNKFQLNPSKCKEFVVSFKRNEPNPPPISINESQIERDEIIDSWFNNHKGFEMERSRGKNSQ
jgi:hypothetical protein